MASKLRGHSLIRDPPLRKVGGPFDPRTLQDRRQCTAIETKWSSRVVPIAPNKSKMAAAAILKVTKIAISPQLFDQFLRNLYDNAKCVC